MNHFYTYILSDPRNGLPFYVGKGQGRRIEHHFREAHTTQKNSYKLQKIRKIESLGLVVIVSKVEENVSDSEAQDFEKLIIAEARAKGIELTNMTDGGDGSAGYKHRPESLAKIGAAQRGVPKPDSQKVKLSAYLLQNPIHLRDGVTAQSGENHWAYGKTGALNPNFGRKDTPEQIAVKRQRLTGKKTGPCTDERRAAIKAATTGVKKSTTINMRKPRSKVECPHCGKVGGANTMHRWHFDNCKDKTPC